MFTYLINERSLIERLVIVGDIITFYVKPIGGNVLGTANVVGGFIRLFNDHFKTRTIHSNDTNHVNAPHCCEGDTYQGIAEFTHFHSQFPKDIDKEMLNNILEYMQKCNKKLSGNTRVWFMSKERAEHIKECFLKSKESGQTHWYDMAPLGFAFLETTKQGFMSGAGSMFFLQLLTTIANKVSLSKQQILCLSNIATAMILYSMTGSIELGVAMMFINMLLEKAGIPQTVVQASNIFGGTVLAASQNTTFAEDTWTRGMGAFLGAIPGTFFGYAANKIISVGCDKVAKCFHSKDNSSSDDNAVRRSPK